VYEPSGASLEHPPTRGEGRDSDEGSDEHDDGDEVLQAPEGAAHAVGGACRDAVEIGHGVSVAGVGVSGGALNGWRCDTEQMFWSPLARDVILVSGPDALTYLHSQVSQDLRPLPVGASTWAFLLQPTGRVDALVRITRRGDDELALDTDVGFGEAVAARVLRFRIRVRAEVEPIAGHWIAVRPEPGETNVPELPGAVAAWGGGVDLFGEAPTPPACREAGIAELESARIEAGWPAMGSEIIPGETIPAELGLNDVAVSFTKGCYPGQELVERMDSRASTAPRLLRVVEVAPGTGSGDDYLVDGEVAGTVTSVQGTRALALVKRSFVER
jgi:folate-binding protein YgfZ